MPEKDKATAEMITKLNTAIAVLNDAKKSLARRNNAAVIRHFCGEEQGKTAKEDSKESIMRRLVVVRGMLNEINRELRGK